MNKIMIFRKMKAHSFILLIFLIARGHVSAQQPVTLNEAVEMALHNNYGIKAGESQVKEAVSKYFYSNNLPGMYPLAGTSVPVLNNGSPTGDNIIMHPMAPYPDNNRDVMTIDFNVTYPIYAGNKRRNALNSTIDLETAYRHDLDETKAHTVLNVKTVFYNILFLNELIKVNKEALTQMNEHLAMAKKAYTEGMRSEFDVLTFENKIEEFRSKIIELEGNKKIALLSLKNLMVLPDSMNIKCIGNFGNDNLFYDSVNSHNIDSVVKNNNRIQSLKSIRQVLDSKAKIEAAENLPVIFAFGNYHVYHGMDFPPFDATWRQGYAIGVGLKINLFDGNMSKGKVDEVRAGIEKIKNYQDGLALKLYNDIQKSFENIESLNSQKISTENTLLVTRKAYEIARTAYENGIITNLELDDAQLNVTRAETSILNIEKSILIEYANLTYLNGEPK
jgi:outer membrane protein TolC